MDTLTHALSGVLAARAAGLSPADRAPLVVVAAAAAFPDVDYLLILFDPAGFLTVHRGPTHSLLLLPLWAWLLAWPLAHLFKLSIRECAAWCALGLTMHVIGDWVTLYGTQLAYPLSDRAFALRLSFDAHLWIASITLVGVVLGSVWRARRAAWITLGAITLVLVGQGLLGRQALAVATDEARQRGLHPAAASAIPQPLSPFHWALIIESDGGYALSYLDLLDRSPERWVPLMGQTMRAYRGKADLVWTHHRSPKAGGWAHRAWAHPLMTAFRRFAESPAVWRLDDERGEVCVWFTDLRFLVPHVPVPFRYGLCKESESEEWRGYHLPWSTTGVRQSL